MNLLVKNIVVVGLVLLCTCFGPWWLVDVGFPFLVLLFLAFVWANLRIWPQIQNRVWRGIAVALFAAMCTAGTFCPLMMTRFERSEEAMWKALFAEIDRLFPYEITDPDGTKHRMSGISNVDLSTHSVRFITNGTWKTVEKDR